MKHSQANSQIAANPCVTDVNCEALPSLKASYDSAMLLLLLAPAASIAQSVTVSGLQTVLAAANPGPSLDRKR